jgi:hypothetical protein
VGVQVPPLAPSIHPFAALGIQRLIRGGVRLDTPRRFNIIFMRASGAGRLLIHLDENPLSPCNMKRTTDLRWN